jgi:predicted aspartyl protease
VGLFKYKFEISAAKDGPFRTIEALVDTGSLYTWIPGKTLRDAGLNPTGTRAFQLADGQIVQRDIVEAVVRLEGDVAHTICVFGGDRDQTLLGAVTLEQFSLAADPVNKRLVPMPAIPAY